MKRLPLPLRGLLLLPGVLVLVVVCYAIYFVAAYHRIPDNLPLTPLTGRAEESTLSTETDYTLASWNLGFGAYSDDYTFFMDEGKESRARSAEAARQNIQGCIDRTAEFEPDFIFYQEVDKDATRTYHHNELAQIEDAFPTYDDLFAVNFDSPYLYWPLIQPHGKSLAGLLTLSRYALGEGLRRSLPIDKSITKVLDLDRCYSVTSVAVENGRRLYLINIHASAYSKEAGTVPAQMEQLAADLTRYYDGGNNYVIVGGDFNQDIPGDSAQKLNDAVNAYSWARAFDRSYLPDHFAVADYTQDALIGTSRYANIPYQRGVSYEVCIDGFILSDNIRVKAVEVQDESYRYTDHNPVLLRFALAD